MSLPVTIENDAIAIEVWPQIGGKVASVVDKADKFQLLFDYPAERPVTAQYDLPYASSWYAGWDECFPAVAPSPYVGHPYDGIVVPDHGELWGLPTTAVPTLHGITTVWHGLRFGYRLTRKLHLEENALIADYTLVNLAPFPFRFVWAMHCLMSMSSPVMLVTGGTPPMRLSHDVEGHSSGEFAWPNLASSPHSLDFSHPSALPSRSSWKLFSQEPIARPLDVVYPDRRRRLRIEYLSVDHPAYWGLWINTGGWAGHRHFAVEPCTGRFDQLDRSIRDHSAATIEPLGKTIWSVKWTLDQMSA